MKPDDEIGARHSPRAHPALLIAPSISTAVSTLRPPLTTVACAQFSGGHFAFGSSFVSPDLRRGLGQLANLLASYPGCPLTIFGHADPVGDDRHNKELGGRRARAVYGLLTHDPQVWNELYENGVGQDAWGLRCLQTILTCLGHEPGPVDGVAGPATHASTARYQAQQGLAATGALDENTRTHLFADYMDFLYGGAFTKLDKQQDFLGRNADARGKADHQGCGEFNPIVILSRAELSSASPAIKARRDAANEPNRRVTILLFEKGTRVNLETWPCPRSTEGPDGCRKRFYADGEARRAAQDVRRLFQETRDTFSCRFYQRLVSESPCEATTSQRPTLRWLVSGRKSGLRPTLVARSVSGEELGRMNGVEVVGDDEGGQCHAFDLLPLASASDVTLETRAAGGHVAPIFSFDLSRFSASLLEPVATAPSIGIALPTAGQPTRPTVDGPDGPDLLDPPIPVEQLPMSDPASQKPGNDDF